LARFVARNWPEQPEVEAGWNHMNGVGPARHFTHVVGHEDHRVGPTRDLP
jgi:hypothetical protein